MKEIILNENSFPSLFQAADQAAIKAQKNHLRLMFFDIVLMMMAAALSVYAFSGATMKILIASVSALLLTISIGLTFILKIVKYDKTWYDGRAVAESVKTLSWRYMTCAEPFPEKKARADIDNHFTMNLLALLKDRKELYAFLGGDYGQKPQITDDMRDMRELSTIERRDLYLTRRIMEQRMWYGHKCEFNKNRERIWFTVIVITQLLAVIAAILVIPFPDSPLNLTGLFTTIAASAIAWLQLKQHQGLSQAYGLAAQELGIIAEKAYHIQTDNELSDFVADSENAVSREHTMWMARRDTLE